MTDISTIWINATGQGDWQIADGALAAGEDLTSAVFISLFTDKQASTDDTPPDGSTDRRGWWGDLDQDVQIGSWLWLLSREKLPGDVEKNAVLYAEEALAWMVTDQIASSVSATAEVVGRNQLTLTITITRAIGSQTFQYAWAWNQLD